MKSTKGNLASQGLPVMAITVLLLAMSCIVALAEKYGQQTTLTITITAEQRAALTWTLAHWDTYQDKNPAVTVRPENVTAFAEALLAYPLELVERIHASESEAVRRRELEVKLCAMSPADRVELAKKLGLPVSSLPCGREATKGEKR